MKKALVSTIMICFIFLPYITLSLSTPKSVNAYANYYRIITLDTPFYSETNQSNALFYLPYSYYVKVLDVKDGLARVEIVSDNLLTIDGYVPFDLLYSENQTVINPYLSLSITTSSPTILYADNTLSYSIQYIFKNRQLTYYGALTENGKETLYYVGYNGRLGYVKEGDVMPFDLPLHKNPLPNLEATKPEIDPETPILSTQQKSKNASDSMRLIILACLLFAGVIGLIIALTNRRKSQTQTACSYYDESDYE